MVVEAIKKTEEWVNEDLVKEEGKEVMNFRRKRSPWDFLRPRRFKPHTVVLIILISSGAIRVCIYIKTHSGTLVRKPSTSKDWV